MRYCKPNAPTDALDKRELDHLRNMMASNRLAVAAAMDYCAEREICPPPWLVAASVELIVDLLKREKSRRRGRTAGYIAQYRQWAWDFERWDAVLEIRRMRKQAKHNLELEHLCPKHYSIKHSKKMQKLLGNSTYEFEAASQYLTGRDAKAGAHAVRASYRKINNDRANVAVFLRDRFLRKIGLQESQDLKPGTKPWPLCSLTP